MCERMRGAVVCNEVSGDKGGECSENDSNVLFKDVLSYQGGRLAIGQSSEKRREWSRVLQSKVLVQFNHVASEKLGRV